MYFLKKNQVLLNNQLYTKLNEYKKITYKSHFKPNSKSSTKRILSKIYPSCLKFGKSKKH